MIEVIILFAILGFIFLFVLYATLCFCSRRKKGKGVEVGKIVQDENNVLHV